MLIGFFVCKPHTLRHSHRTGRKPRTPRKNASQNSTKKKTTHITVSRLGGGSKGSRSAAGGDTAVRRALARAIKSIYPRNPISTFGIAWRTPMDGIATARGGGRRQRGMGRVARCSHQSKPPQPPHGAQAPHSSQKRLTKQHKKRRLTSL